MIRWLTVFADLPADRFEPTVAFWAAVTGSTVSARRGDLDEFATLLPASGTPILKVQRLGSGPARLHLDLHVPDVAAATEQAAGLGAQVVHAGGWSVLSSPAGFVHCLVGHFAGADLPPPFTLPGAGTSLVNQLAIDIPADRFAAEVAYWTALTGWPARTVGDLPRVHLPRPGDRPPVPAPVAAPRRRRRAGRGDRAPRPRRRR